MPNNEDNGDVNPLPENQSVIENNKSRGVAVFDYSERSNCSSLIERVEEIVSMLTLIVYKIMSVFTLIVYKIVTLLTLIVKRCLTDKLFCLVDQ